MAPYESVKYAPPTISSGQTLTSSEPQRVTTAADSAMSELDNEIANLRAKLSHLYDRLGPALRGSMPSNEKQPNTNAADNSSTLVLALRGQASKISNSSNLIIDIIERLDI